MHIRAHWHVPHTHTSLTRACALIRRCVAFNMQVQAGGASEFSREQREAFSCALQRMEQLRVYALGRRSWRFTFEAPLCRSGEGMGWDGRMSG